MDYVLSWCDANNSNNKALSPGGSVNGVIGTFSNVKMNVLVSGDMKHYGSKTHQKFCRSGGLNPSAISREESPFSQQQRCLRSGVPQHSHHACNSDATMKQVLDTLCSSQQTLLQWQQQNATNNYNVTVEPRPLGPIATRMLVDKVSLSDSAWKKGDLNLITSLMMSPDTSKDNLLKGLFLGFSADLALDQEKGEDESFSPLMPLDCNPKKRDLDDLLAQDEDSGREVMTESKKHKKTPLAQQHEQQQDLIMQQLLDDMAWEAQDDLIHDDDEDTFNELCYNDYSDDVDQSCSSTTHETRPIAARNTSSSPSSSMTSSTISTCKTKNEHDGEGKQRSHSYDSWESHLQDLISFKKEHGHCLVPYDYADNPKLAQWTKRQRYQYKLKMSNQHSTLTDERKRALDELGFTWDLHKAAWLEKLESMKAFKAAHGHTNVPSHYALDAPLAVWVKCQRRQYKLYRLGKQSSMNEERFADLSALGFDWNPRNIV